MARIAWDAPGDRYYEAGIDRGVLYVGENPGVPWVGLVSVDENVEGGDARSFYIDGIKYLTLPSNEEYAATISAFTYPDLFAQCEGYHEPRSGLFLSHQRRKTFGFSYRTKIGNGETGDLGYKIHIVYNALVAPTSRSYSTLSDTTDPVNFSWDIVTKAPAMSGYKPTSHIILDSRQTDPFVMSIVEDILYGNETDMARLPSLSELLVAYDTTASIVITDNGDGTWTAEAPFDTIRMTSPTSFEISAATAVYLDESTYEISSSE